MIMLIHWKSEGFMSQRKCTNCTVTSVMTVWNKDFCPRCGFDNDGGKAAAAHQASNQQIEEVKGVITSECVFGMNVFKDFFAGMTDFFGGRSESSQKVLRDARETCLNELKKEAYELGADGVIGIDLDYSEISGKGKGMLFLVASGTAVKFKE